jgi:hypothetical protein
VVIDLNLNLNLMQIYGCMYGIVRQSCMPMYIKAASSSMLDTNLSTVFNTIFSSICNSLEDTSTHNTSTVTSLHYPQSPVMTQDYSLISDALAPLIKIPPLEVRARLARQLGPGPNSHTAFLQICATSDRLEREPGFTRWADTSSSAPSTPPLSIYHHLVGTYDPSPNRRHDATLPTWGVCEECGKVLEARALGEEGIGRHWLGADGSRCTPAATAKYVFALRNKTTLSLTTWSTLVDVEGVRRVRVRVLVPMPKSVFAPGQDVQQQGERLTYETGSEERLLPVIKISSKFADALPGQMPTGVVLPIHSRLQDYRPILTPGYAQGLTALPLQNAQTEPSWVRQLHQQQHWQQQQQQAYRNHSAPYHSKGYMYYNANDSGS